MTKKQYQSSLWRPGLIIMAAIIIPGLLLSILAMRTARHEEAFMEKQLHTTFSAELTQSVYSLQQLLENIQDSLDATVPDIAGKDIQTVIHIWDSTAALVDIPFIFNQRGNVLWPPETNRSQRDRNFLAVNHNFFLNRQAVEVYRSISDEYVEQMIASKRNRLDTSKKKLSDVSLRKQAKDDFARSTNIQKKVYKDLQNRGKVVPLRNIVTGSKNTATVEAYSPQLSTYISEPMRFSQIVSTAESGLIPRIIDQQFILIYWKKSGTNTIIGCSVDISKLLDRIIPFLPQSQTDIRYLTILDHNGKPAIPSKSYSPQNWKHPFAAREISRLLPRWEIAIYLVSPQALASRARFNALVIALLTGILFITITISGVILFRIMRTEIRLARQKTTFVTNVSHELKTPLTSIRIFAELLKEQRQPDPEKQKKYLGIMVSEIERLTRLINNVLDFARMNKGKKTYSKRICDIHELCMELAENQRFRLEHNNFTFVTNFPDEKIVVSIDPEAMKQALLNILSNAEKYSAKNKWIGFSLAREGTQVIIHIADRGIGIAPSLKDRIFKEFYRVDDSLTAKVQGTGLGLTITRQILQDHGGDIRYQKNKPAGTEFIISLPLLTEESSET